MYTDFPREPGIHAVADASWGDRNIYGCLIMMNHGVIVGLGASCQGMHTPRSEVSYHVSNSSDPANMHANMGEGVEYHTLYGGRPYLNHYTNPYP
jgi:hypothetical protein